MVTSTPLVPKRVLLRHLWLAKRRYCCAGQGVSKNGEPCYCVGYAVFEIARRIWYEYRDTARPPVVSDWLADFETLPRRLCEPRTVQIFNLLVRDGLLLSDAAAKMGIAVETAKRLLARVGELYAENKLVG